MEMRNSLLTETIERISAAQTSLPQSFNMTLEAVCSAYRGADLTVAYYGVKLPDPEAKQIAARSRDRFLSELRPLLDQLVIQ